VSCFIEVEKNGIDLMKYWEFRNVPLEKMEDGTFFKLSWRFTCSELTVGQFHMGE